MKQFKKILVAVDLENGEETTAAAVTEPTREAIKRATWLANLNAAKLRFFHAIDVSDAPHAGDADDWKESVRHRTEGVLNRLVAGATDAGINADMEVCFGKSWLEIIRNVLGDGHDLVIAGSRRLSGLRRLLVGSTGIKLLRKCPCPVWITQPRPKQLIPSILVAHCLRGVGDTAMQLGCSMAELHGSQLHVLHSVEFEEASYALPSRVSAADAAKYRSNATDHINTQLAQYNLVSPATVHLVTEPADFAIVRLVKEHDIQLVTMGTIARTGVAGFITGNTAERLLPQIPCSVLAVKPEGFVSPVDSSTDS